jgi:hypothetical protein
MLLEFWKVSVLHLFRYDSVKFLTRCKSFVAACNCSALWASLSFI